MQFSTQYWSQSTDFTDLLVKSLKTLLCKKETPDLSYSSRGNKTRLWLILKKLQPKTLFFHSSALFNFSRSLCNINFFTLAYSPHQGWKPGKCDFHHWSPDPPLHILFLQTHQPGIHILGSHCGTVQWPSLLRVSDCWHSCGLWVQTTEVSLMVLNSYCFQYSASAPLRPNTMNCKTKFNNGNKAWILIYIYIQLYPLKRFINNMDSNRLFYIPSCQLITIHKNPHLLFCRTDT